MTKGKYVDGFVIVIPKKNAGAYKKMAKLGAKMWKKFGALDYKECKGNDLNPWGDAMPLNFIKLTGAKPTDDVWFSFIVFKNKKHRDTVNAQVMKAFGDNPPEMPFDMKKFSTGGFEVVVD